MQFNITTDYAIRAVVLLAATDKQMTTEEIGTQMGIPLNYLRKLMKKLNKSGILEVERGRHGGFSLKKEADEISLYEIVASIEPTIKINRCLEEDCYCSRHAITSCPVRKLYANIQLMFEGTLKSYTIGDLLS